MQLSTTRFGNVEIQVDDILLFPQGLIAFEDCRHWVILADAETSAVAWLQSVSRPEIALPVVSPRRFQREYQTRVTRGQLEPLQLRSLSDAHVLAIVGRDGDKLTVNLQAPVIVNLQQRLGQQLVTCDDQPVAHEIASIATSLRKSA